MFALWYNIFCTWWIKTWRWKWKWLKCLCNQSFLSSQRLVRPPSGPFPTHFRPNFDPCIKWINSVIRLLRVARVARKMDHFAEYSGVVLILLVGAFVLFGHWLACMWFAIGKWDKFLRINYNQFEISCKQFEIICNHLQSSAICCNKFAVTWTLVTMNLQRIATSCSWLLMI